MAGTWQHDAESMIEPSGRPWLATPSTMHTSRKLGHRILLLGTGLNVHEHRSIALYYDGTLLLVF